LTERHFSQISRFMNVKRLFHGLILEQLDREMTGDDVVRTAGIKHSV
jgi:hypothetical protein